MSTTTMASTPPRRLRRVLADTTVLARRNVLATLRLRDVLILSAIQPLIFMLLFLYVFGGAIETALPPAAGGSYINWLVPGILAQFAVFGASVLNGTEEPHEPGVEGRSRAPYRRHGGGDNAGVVGGGTVPMQWCGALDLVNLLLRPPCWSARRRQSQLVS